MSSSLDIIIVNWNAGPQLGDCLRSILEEKSVDLKRVVVIDNASSDDSLDGIQDLRLPMTIIRNEENRGFSAACNQGASGSSADQLLFLNPDTRLYEGALAKAVDCLESRTEEGVGIVGVQLVDDQGGAIAAVPGFLPFSVSSTKCWACPDCRHTFRDCS